MARSDEKREKRDEGTTTNTTSSSKLNYNKFVPYSCFNVIDSKFHDPLYMIKNQFFYFLLRNNNMHSSPILSLILSINFYV